MTISGRTLFINALTLSVILSAIPSAPGRIVSKLNAGPILSDVPNPEEIDSSKSELRAFIERYLADRNSLGRSYATDLSGPLQVRVKQFYTEWLGTLAKLNFDTLTPEGKIDYILFKYHIEHEIQQLDLTNKARAEMAALLPFSETIISLAETRRRMEKIDSAKAAATLNDLSKQIETARRSLEGSLRADPNKLKKTVANRAATAINGLRGTLRSWFAYYDAYDPLFTWWANEPYKAVDQSLVTYSTFLTERVVGIRSGDAGATLAGRGAPAGVPGGGGPGGGGGGFGGGRGPGGGGGVGGGGAAGARSGTARSGDLSDIIGDPIGREGLMVELASEMIPYTPEELIAIAYKELDWCESEMKKASREMGFGDDWKKALEKVKDSYVEPGKQPEMILGLALEAIDYVEKNNLVTVPPLAKESWRMEMMAPERQLVSPFFLGGETILVSYPTNTMSHEQKMMSMRGNNPHFSRATVHHELIPGHHLQGYMTQRYKPYRGLFSTPFWTEGWSLYWELLLWDRGFAKTPEDKIGMLFWRSHRCARIIFSLSFHLEKMTPQECVDLLINRVGHEADNAAGEVRRSFAGGYGPLYQAAYLLGGMQIFSLHKELVNSGKMTDRDFHDTILKENRIPIEMVRAVLTKQKVTRDFKSSWRFYGPAPTQ